MKSGFLFAGLFTMLIMLVGADQPATKTLLLSPDGSSRFQSAEYKLSILFPGSFEEEITNREENNKTLYTLKVTCTLENDLYMATATKHVVALKDPVYLAGISLKSFVETLKGELRSENSFTYKKKEGKEALIYLPEQKMYAHYRVILAGMIQYQVIVLDNKEALSKTAKNFFKSFQII